MSRMSSNSCMFLISAVFCTGCALLSGGLPLDDPHLLCLSGRAAALTDRLSYS